MQTLATVSSKTSRGSVGQRKKGILLKTHKVFVSRRETVLQRGDRISGKQFIPYTFAYSIPSVWL